MIRRYQPGRIQLEIELPGALPTHYTLEIDKADEKELSQNAIQRTGQWLLDQNNLGGEVPMSNQNMQTVTQFDSDPQQDGDQQVNQQCSLMDQRIPSPLAQDPLLGNFNASSTMIQSGLKAPANSLIQPDVGHGEFRNLFREQLAHLPRLETPSFSILNSQITTKCQANTTGTSTVTMNSTAIPNAYEVISKVVADQPFNPQSDHNQGGAEKITQPRLFNQIGSNQFTSNDFATTTAQLHWTQSTQMPQTTLFTTSGNSSAPTFSNFNMNQNGSFAGGASALPLAYDPAVTFDMQPNHEQPQLTPSQIAARHVVPKKLPIFYGDVEKFPKFLSAFETSTKLCDFTNGENLPRLTECLKGTAYDFVEHQLFYPDDVPKVIELLKTIFEKPEYIINKLLEKIAKQPAPQAEGLTSSARPIMSETLELQYFLRLSCLSLTGETSTSFKNLFNESIASPLEEKAGSFPLVVTAESSMSISSSDVPRTLDTTHSDQENLRYPATQLHINIKTVTGAPPNSSQRLNTSPLVSTVPSSNEQLEDPLGDQTSDVNSTLHSMSLELEKLKSMQQAFVESLSSFGTQLVSITKISQSIEDHDKRVEALEIDNSELRSHMRTLDHEICNDDEAPQAINQKSQQRKQLLLNYKE
ncbi:hypothetical protein Bhyg_03506 [Pseudolycoriella hygida]|uniref:Uncharacterized protein n=1 Tax=Pseudolycoriella hygida TaxID=35572 RepID=A0A9Q0S8T2_9DIPT|nr:hypothetical protein Bhyg_03506 [Pseudolycoriella hygida]